MMLVLMLTCVLAVSARPWYGSDRQGYDYQPNRGFDLYDSRGSKPSHDRASFRSQWARDPEPRYMVDEPTESWESLNDEYNNNLIDEAYEAMLREQKYENSLGNGDWEDNGRPRNRVMPEERFGNKVRDDLDYNQLYRALADWRQQEMEVPRESGYGYNQDQTYYNNDEEYHGWDREPVNNVVLDKLFDGKLSQPRQESPRVNFQDMYEDEEPQTLLHDIGMRLMDLTAQTTPFPEGEVEEEEDDDDAKSSSTMTVEKARSLLEQLKVAEDKRDKSVQNKKVLDKSELDKSIFAEDVIDKSSSARAHGAEDDDNAAEVESDEDNADYDDDQDDLDDDEEDKNILMETELALLKQENDMLIEAIQYAVESPLEEVMSPEAISLMRTLVSRASIRQDAADYIDYKIQNGGDLNVDM